MFQKIKKQGGGQQNFDKCQFLYTLSCLQIKGTLTSQTKFSSLAQFEPLIIMMGLDLLNSA